MEYAGSAGDGPGVAGRTGNKGVFTPLCKSAYWTLLRTKPQACLVWTILALVENNVREKDSEIGFGFWVFEFGIVMVFVTKSREK